MLGNEKDYIATRVAYELNLHGPAVSVHTACSTSLVAMAQAVDSLRAASATWRWPAGRRSSGRRSSGYLYQEGAMLSPDGRTRTSTPKRKGTCFSDGAAVVLLKRLSRRARGRRPVYAVIRGAAVNNDGGDKASFTAPSVAGRPQ